MTRASPSRKAAAHCHFLVKETAISMAHETYDALMMRDDWYKLWRSSHPEMNAAQLEVAWVAQRWGRFVEGARAALAESLSRPLPEHLKEQIAEALILDKSLVRGRGRGDQIIGRL